MDMHGRGIRYSSVLHEGLSSVFYCWLRVKRSTEVEEEFVACRPEDFWKFTGEERSYTNFVARFVKPRGVVTVSLRSRQAFNFGVFELRTELPRFPEGPMLWFGFEADDLFGGGVLHFMWRSSEGRLYAFVGSSSARAEMELTPIIGADLSSGHHHFKIVYRRGLALWYVDGFLRALAILGAGDVCDAAILYSSKPYAVGCVRDPPAAELPILLDIDGGDTSKEYVWKGIHPWGLRVFNGDPELPLFLDLYLENTDTRLRGSVVEDRVVSAPFPGTLSEKELWFEASSSGRLIVESFEGDRWSTYAILNVKKNEPHNLKIKDRALMYRTVFEPEEKAVVREARVFMR